jgi:hypothetical protein
MLFKIGDMLIISASEEDAKAIFKQETKTQLTLPIQCLISEDQTFTYISTDITRIADIETLVKGCLDNINNRYKDSLISIKSIYKHIDVLSADHINKIFLELVKNGFNESKSLIFMYSKANFGEKIPLAYKTQWTAIMSTYICKYWLIFHREQDQWTIAPRCDTLFQQSDQKGIFQYNETDEQIYNLGNAQSRNDRIKLLNSVNFSYETLESHCDDYPGQEWVLDHYNFKQKVIREGNVEFINENRNGDRAVL